MSGGITETTVRDVLQRTSLAAIVGEHVTLKKVGSRLVGLCPFHGEKTPSFSVNEQRGFYHCFGCGVSGDAISFIRNHMGLNFVEAVQQLADRAGIRIELDTSPLARAKSNKRQQERERNSGLAALNGAVANYFHQRLLRLPRNHAVWEYVRSRRLDEPAVEAFQIGWAPDAWGDLADWLGQRGLSLRDASSLGLVAKKKSGQGYYDRFRHRLMFPIVDVSGRIIAFGGRALPDSVIESGDRPPAKYINSPESPLYTKGHALFGLAQARTAIRKKGRAVVVEGNLDLVMLHRAGFDEAVAPLGTALTEAQMLLLKRFTERVVFLYDGDSAGRAAARKALLLALDVGLEGAVATLPRGEDPDSYLARHGAPALASLLDRALPLLDYLLDDLVDENGQSEEGKAKTLAELAPYFASISEFRQRDLYLAKIAGALQLDERRALRLLKPDPRAAVRRPSSAMSLSAPGLGPARAPSESPRALGRAGYPRGVAGPSVSGPSVSGPPVSGPSVSGPSVSGPPVSGPPVSGRSTPARSTSARVRTKRGGAAAASDGAPPPAASGPGSSDDSIDWSEWGAAAAEAPPSGPLPDDSSAPPPDESSGPPWADGSESAPASNARGAVGRPVEVPTTSRAAETPPLAPMYAADLPLRERDLVTWCLQHPSCLELVEGREAADWLEHRELRGVLWEAIVLSGETQRLDPVELLDRLPTSPLRGWVAEVLTADPGFDEAQCREHVDNALGWLGARKRRHELQSLQRELARAEREGDRQRVVSLAREMMALRSLL